MKKIISTALICSMLFSASSMVYVSAENTESKLKSNQEKQEELDVKIKNLNEKKEEVEENRKKDGVIQFKNYLMERGIWSEEHEAELTASIAKQIKEATEYADNAPFPKPEDTLLHVYAEDGEVNA